MDLDRSCANYKYAYSNSSANGCLCVHFNVQSIKSICEVCVYNNVREAQKRLTGS
jgi:hypothetical protein